MIKDDPRPVRTIAAELGMSKTTVQTWKHRETFEDLPRTPKSPSGIKPFEIAVFRELLRLTRYRYQRLFEYLEPVWSALPTQERIDCRREGAFWRDAATGKFVNRMYDPITFYRQLKKLAGGKLLTSFDQTTSAAGTIATHRVRVKWRNTHEEMVAGEILLLLERQSGLVYARSFTGRIDIKSFAIALSQFEQMLSYQAKTLTFVSSLLELPPRSGRWDRFSSLFRFKLGKSTPGSAGDRLPVSENSLEELKDHYPLKIEVFLDPVSPNQDRNIVLPGRYGDRKELDRTLAKLCNLINLTPHQYCFRGGVVPMCPLERIREELQRSGTRKTRGQLRRKIELPRKFRDKTGTRQVPGDGE